MAKIRLNKYLKEQNICSRRKADDFIARGLIKVNDEIITTLGTIIDDEIDIVSVVPEVEEEKEQFRYILLNKPVGYVCSKSNDEGSTIFELLPKIKDLSYAGRLDKDSSGLVLLANDGKFVYQAMGSEFNCRKEYIVKVNKIITEIFLHYQRAGIIKLSGKLVKKANVEQIDDTMYKITLTEGMHHQIRRMAENQGYKVLTLKRVRIADISDKNLAIGGWRDLTRDEIASIYKKTAD